MNRYQLENIIPCRDIVTLIQSFMYHTKTSNRRNRKAIREMLKGKGVPDTFIETLNNTVKSKSKTPWRHYDTNKVKKWTKIFNLPTCDPVPWIPVEIEMSSEEESDFFHEVFSYCEHIRDLKQTDTGYKFTTDLYHTEREDFDKQLFPFLQKAIALYASKRRDRGLRVRYS